MQGVQYDFLIIKILRNGEGKKTGRRHPPLSRSTLKDLPRLKERYKLMKKFAHR